MTTISAPGQTTAPPTGGRVARDAAARRWIAVTAAAASAIYAAAMVAVAAPVCLWLFLLLILTQFFRLCHALIFCHTVWPRRVDRTYDPEFTPPVDVFITTTGEDLAILAETVRAVREQDYADFNVYVLNDGYVVHAPNWREVEALAAELGVHCITRRAPGGAKAGNINHALGLTRSPFVAILDVDHVPHRDFLRSLAGWLADPQVAFVQSPQYYRNWSDSYVARVASEQQELFFGAVTDGKNALNSVFMCGTNMIVRRRALEDVGGLDESNVTEDFLTSLFLHRKGWQSVYVPKILCEGLIQGTWA